MIELKVEISKELTTIIKRKNELKEEIFSKKNNEKISSLKLDFTNLMGGSK